MNVVVPEVGLRARSRISNRLLPFLLVLFLLAFIDRANVAVAAKGMRQELGFSADVIGTGAGIFFIGYFLLEIPGTLIVERWSARKWIARIMVSWGIVASLMGLIGLPFLNSIGVQTQFYSLRFILGLAEAGFFPGVIVYLSHWFRYEDRGKTKSFFLIGIPLASIISNPLSEFIMSKVNWMDWSGWRWVFILEGIPSVIMGVVTWFYLTDRPEQAKWLPEDEKQWIIDELAKEKKQKMELGGSTILSALRDKNVWLLCAIYLFAVTGMYGFTFFLPSITERMSDASNFVKTLIGTLPYVFGLAAILLNGSHSDKTLERRWHTAIPLLLAAVSLGFAAAFSSSTYIAATFMCLLGLTLYAYIPVFWTHPTARLTASSAAFAVGLINSVGNLGGFFGPKVVGVLKDRSGDYASGLWFLSGCILMAGLLATALTTTRAAKR
jgi:MFS transporter, ACS family, tartrate transporter